MPALRASVSKIASAALARANARSRSISNTAATAAPRRQRDLHLRFHSRPSRIQMRGARHRQRDRPVDDRTYQAFRGNVDEQIFQHGCAPHVLK